MFVFPYTFDVCFSVLSINSLTAVIFVFRCCNFPILSIPSNYQISHESFIVVNKIRDVLRFGWWFLDVLMLTYFILTHSVFGVFLHLLRHVIPICELQLFYRQWYLCCCSISCSNLYFILTHLMFVFYRLILSFLLHFSPEIAFVCSNFFFPISFSSMMFLWLIICYIYC